MAKLMINKNKKEGTIAPEIYGHFSEHLGRCIYEGLYVGENSEIPNVNGMRTDVVEALKEIKIPVLRWPGGCFADEYHWKDGIGPKENRKKMINTHWGGVVEDNSFGTHEFFELCRQLGCKTYINGNLGSGTVQEIYNEPTNRFVANFIGESNIISGRMIEDYKVRFDDITFDCVDQGFKENEPVDVVIRPEDIDIVDVKDGKMTGEVLSVLFKGVHYEIMVETVPGTSVTVNMRVIRNHDVTSEDGSEKISANNFYVDLEDVENLDDKEIVALSNAQAWETESDEYISIANIEYELEAKEGQYPVTFSTANGTSIERTIFVVNQPFVKNEKANEGVMAFNFFKTVDEITESQALDTDLKTWANAQGWKLTDEDQSVDISVDYDFDPEEVTEGVYEITFSTTGREFKIHTTDYSEEGQEVGLTFFPEDIHVMPKVVF